MIRYSFLFLFLASPSWAGQYTTCAQLVGSAGTRYDYVIAGAGIGGSIMATRLAEAGHSVLLVEAGPPVIPVESQVPVLHAAASETEVVALDYAVQHYDQHSQAKADPKFDSYLGGVLYPRGEGIGGSSLINALISILPHRGDWDHIGEITGDPTWNDETMMAYWTHRIERNRHRTILRFLDWVGKTVGIKSLQNIGGHGFNGWLTVSQPRLEFLKQALGDRQLRRIVLTAEKTARPRTGSFGAFLRRAASFFDPNDWRAVSRDEEGLVLTPLAVDEDGQRNGVRDLVLSAAAKYPDRLHILTGALVSKIVLDENNRATGVQVTAAEYALEGDGDLQGWVSPMVEFQAERGVISSGGAFQTPYLLKLSGIGPKEELEQHGIKPRIDLPGVGANLHDRYQVPVISTLREALSVLKDAGPDGLDAIIDKWRAKGSGLYSTNGIVVSMMIRSDPALDKPDLFIFGVPGAFPGYYNGYSEDLAKRKDSFSWIVLKARTNNRGGQVLLASSDPRAQPDIRFHYFDEGTDGEGRPLTGADEQALVEGVKLVRQMNASLSDIIAAETNPGPGVGTDDQLRQWVKDIAWGHHATGTAAFGSVVDSRFRVMGAQNLWVVDASVFPSIPGTFIAVPTMMAAERASDVILEDSGK